MARPALLAGLLGLAALLPRALPCAPAHAPEAHEGPAPLLEYRSGAMGTPLLIRVVAGQGVPRETIDRVVAEAQAEVERLDRLLSEWKPGSPLRRLNDHPRGGPVVLPEPTFSLLARALEWSRRSHGAFDPSFASLWGLWRFDQGDAARIPTPEEARARARLIDYRKIHLDRAARTVRLEDPDMKIGLGGIAKGYAVDRVVERLRAAGLRDFFVQFGGELFLSGRRGERPWLVGVADPRAKDRYFAMLAVENSAFTTSGDYEHFLIRDGVRYHHIIDPSTGYPARGARGVSIVAPRAEDADALSTTCFVLGAKKALALVESLPGVEMVMVTGEGEVVLSSGLEGKIDLRPLTPYEGP